MSNLKDLFEQNVLETLKRLKATKQEMNKLDETLDKKLGNIATPEMFGAIGDGITDDTEAFTKAIKSNCNTIILTKKYLIQDVALKSNLTITGFGEGEIVVKDRTVIKGAFKAVGTESDILKNIDINGIQFSHKDPTFTENGRVIVLQICENVNIHDCTFKNWTGDAIIIDNYPSNKDLTKNISIYNNKFINNNNGRQGVTIFEGSNIRIYDNYFHKTTTNGMPGAIDIEPWELNSGHDSIHDIYINNNNCELDTGYFVNISTPSLYKLKNIFITNNIIKNNVGSISIQKISSLTDDNTDNIVIENNDITSGGFSLLVDNVSNILVKNNIIRNGYFSFSNTYIDNVQGNRNITIEGNAFINDIYKSENAFGGFKLFETTKLLIVDNKFISENNKFYNAFHLEKTEESNIKPLIFSNTMVTNWNGDFGFLASKAQNAIFKGNILQEGFEDSYE